MLFKLMSACAVGTLMLGSAASGQQTSPPNAQDELQWRSSMERRLAELEDKETIRQLIYYKARAADRADPVAEVKTLAIEGQYKGMNAEERAAMIRQKWDTSHHQIGNILIDLDGNEARTETYATAFHRTYPTVESNEFTIGRKTMERLGLDPKKSHELMVGLRYIETFRKIEGQWKIVSRRHIFDWTKVGEPGEIEDGLYSRVQPAQSGRKPDDYSYSSGAFGEKDLERR